jgi:hypothetical protein
MFSCLSFIQVKIIFLIPILFSLILQICRINNPAIELESCVNTSLWVRDEKQILAFVACLNVFELTNGNLIS